MKGPRVLVVGGGAAGFFGAIRCAEAMTSGQVTVLEKSAEFLAKVRISGGGRCNVTHSNFDPRDMATRYPRGGQALIGPFQRFQPADTMAWFESRGVRLKTEDDGRVFPRSDDSLTIVNCLLDAARAAGVECRTRCDVRQIRRMGETGFELELDHGECLVADAVLLATGGCRSPMQGQLAVSLGHTLEPPVPSLFAFDVVSTWLKNLAGVSVEAVEASVAGGNLREKGPLLITHRGLSGPVILRLSAWGARELHARSYCFVLRVNWLPQFSLEEIGAELEARRKQHGARLIVNSPLPTLTARLWEQLVLSCGVPRTTRWSALSRGQRHALIQTLVGMEIPVTGKSLNRDEFVTCGGVALREVDFKTMQSRVCPNLYFAGELLDIDGLTGGFNFQSAWTSGWIAGQAMARVLGGG